MVGSSDFSSFFLSDLVLGALIGLNTAQSQREHSFMLSK